MTKANSETTALMPPHAAGPASFFSSSTASSSRRGAIEVVNSGTKNSGASISSTQLKSGSAFGSSKNRLSKSPPHSTERKGPWPAYGNST